MVWRISKESTNKKEQIHKRPHLRSGINRPIRVTCMGHRTFTIHRIRYEQDIQRICRGMLGLT